MRQCGTALREGQRGRSRLRDDAHIAYKYLSGNGIGLEDKLASIRRVQRIHAFIPACDIAAVIATQKMKLQCSILAAGLLSSLVSAQGGFGGPPKQERVEVTKVEGFKWTDPFANRKYKRFTPKCSVKQTFQAFEYELRDMGEEPPKGLAAFGDGLKKVFRSREYPGGWGGWDKHRDDRSILMMEYFDMPVKVREWIEEQERDDGEGKGLFAVFNKPAVGNKVYNTVTPPAPEKAAGLRPLDKKKLVFFAPGAMYDILPLWVAADSGCEGKWRFGALS
jgi:hypothetical protein